MKYRGTYTITFGVEADDIAEAYRKLEDRIEGIQIALPDLVIEERKDIKELDINRIEA